MLDLFRRRSATGDPGGAAHRAQRGAELWAAQWEARVDPRVHSVIISEAG